MRRDDLVDELAMAARHVATGWNCIRRQHDVIARLERHGLATERARRLLARFEESQRAHVAHHERIAQELRSCSGARPSGG